MVLDVQSRSPTQPRTYSSDERDVPTEQMMLEQGVSAELAEPPQDDKESELQKEDQEELQRYREMGVATAIDVVKNDSDDGKEKEKDKKNKCCTYTAILFVLVAIGAIIATSYRKSTPSKTTNHESPADIQEEADKLTFGTGTALVMMSVQDCFMEASVSSTGQAGSLQVTNTVSLIPIINQIRKERGCLFDFVVRSNDMHPMNHISFASTHGLPPFAHRPAVVVEKGGGLPIACSSSATNPSCCPTFWLDEEPHDCEEVLCPNVTAMSSEMINHVLDSPACSVCVEFPERCFRTTQNMWPDHCIQNAESDFPPSLYTEHTDIIENKGLSMYVDAYSAFWDNTRSIPTTLDQTLKSRSIHTLYFSGVTTDYGVLHSAIHAKSLGYNVVVIRDATRGITEEGTQEAILRMIQEGISIVDSDVLMRSDCPSE